jgi:hypothetical protein
LGFPTTESKFQVRFEEFTLPARVFQADSLNTVNTRDSPTKRLLLGSLNDPVFGSIGAHAYTQIIPAVRPTIAATAVFEKATLTIAYDHYHYGPREAGMLTVQVFELADSIDPNRGHYFNTRLALGARLGEMRALVNPDAFDDAIVRNTDRDTRNDVIDTLFTELSPDFGSRLFLLARHASVNNTTDLAQFSRFRQQFKGFAVVPATPSHIFGVNPNSLHSRITIFYREDGVSRRFALTFTDAVTGFTRFEVNRAGLPLPAFNQFFTPFEGPVAATQAGTGLITRMDIAQVYAFFDALRSPILNSAQLTVSSDFQHQRMPAALHVRVLRPDNRNRLPLRTIVGPDGSLAAAEDATFQGRHAVLKNRDFTLDVMGDNAARAELRGIVSGGTATYSVFLTTFFQTQLRLPPAERLTTLGLLAGTPDFLKSLHGFSFPADRVKLRVYYTVPE